MKSCCLGTLTIALFAGTASADPMTAEAVYDATGVQGGLVVHLGCGDGRLTADLHVCDRYVIHGLDTDAAKVAATRELLQRQGLYGPVSADTFDGRHLPYADDTVNLLAVSDPSFADREEVARVLCPGGVAIKLQAGGEPVIADKFVKPRPAEIDEWSHFLHDAGGNAVAEDSQIGPPKALRRVAEPRWCRSHEFPSSVNAVVVAGGRVFTIFDEGPPGVYRNLPQRCSLIARDAANGVLLWKVAMRQWQPEFGTGTGGRWSIHHTIPRRLVAEGDRVYVTLRFLDSPVSVLDAATGEILTEALEGTEGADEMLLSDGVLIVKVTEGRSVAATERIGLEQLSQRSGISRGQAFEDWLSRAIRIGPVLKGYAGAGRAVSPNASKLSRSRSSCLRRLSVGRCPGKICCWCVEPGGNKVWRAISSMWGPKRSIPMALARRGVRLRTGGSSGLQPFPICHRLLCSFNLS